MANYNVILSDSGHQVFSRAASKNVGAQRTAQDVLFFLDADMVVPHKQIEQAIEQARSTGLALAYSQYIYLSKDNSQRVYEGSDPFWVDSEYTINWPVGGAIAFHRDIYPRYDEEFVGWGMEDVAIIELLRKDGIGLNRIKGKAVHLWHPGHKRGPNEIKNEERYRKLYLGEQ